MIKWDIEVKVRYENQVFLYPCCVFLYFLVYLRKRKRRAETAFDSAARDATQIMAEFRSSNTREVKSY